MSLEEKMTRDVEKIIELIVEELTRQEDGCGLYVGAVLGDVLTIDGEVNLRKLAQNIAANV